MRWYVASVLLEFASLFSAPPSLFFLPWPIILQSTLSSITIRSMFAVCLIRKKPQNTMICRLNLKLGCWWNYSASQQNPPQSHQEMSRCFSGHLAASVLPYPYPSLFFRCEMLHKNWFLVHFFVFMIGMKLFAVCTCPCGLNSRCCVLVVRVPFIIMLTAWIVPSSLCFPPAPKSFTLCQLSKSLFVLQCIQGSMNCLTQKKKSA